MSNPKINEVRETKNKRDAAFKNYIGYIRDLRKSEKELNKINDERAEIQLKKDKAWNEYLKY